MSLLLLLRTNTGGAPVVPGVFGDPQFTRSIGGAPGRVGVTPISGSPARIGDATMPRADGDWS